MVELRDYQQDLLTQVQAALAVPSARVMLQLPTGGGKTRIAGELLSGWLKGGRKAVWLTHRRELAQQTAKMLSEVGVSATCDINWVPRSSAPAITGGVVILMAQTVSRRNATADVWNQYDVNDLLIIDEAHHATAEGWARAIRQWPGPVLGMTATPWRLSEKEGFDHLFNQLLCGPLVNDLQSDGWLCGTRVLSPPEEARIRGGELDQTGDYSEAGIATANMDNPDILTAGALQFWSKHARERQTIVYAVSVEHAQNLVKVFGEARITAGLILGSTPSLDRAKLIDGFRRGTLSVLVNVAVATEGFDLPDAACVVLARPTMSLSLYMQMVGRGMRPKPQRGDCIVLDLAGNSFLHGLPEEDREWSLAPRGASNPEGQPLVVSCPECDGLSAAANHYCIHCGEAFGETCARCGVWRAWSRWNLMNECAVEHDRVCDLCHADAHIRANLPVNNDVEGLAGREDSGYLSPDRDQFLKNLLSDARLQFYGHTGKRIEELTSLIEARKAVLVDDLELIRSFENHLVELPTEEQPENDAQKFRLYNQWESQLRAELARWHEELLRLESQEVDGQFIFNTAREEVLRLLENEARDMGLLPAKLAEQSDSGAIDSFRELRDSPDSGHWQSFTQLREWGKQLMHQDSKTAPFGPTVMRIPDGVEVPVRNWTSLLEETCEWLIRQGLLDSYVCPIALSRRGRKYLVHSVPIHHDRKDFGAIKKLSNGLYLETKFAAGVIAQYCAPLVERFDQDPARFHVHLD